MITAGVCAGVVFSCADGTERYLVFGWAVEDVVSKGKEVNALGGCVKSKVQDDS